MAKVYDFRYKSKGEVTMSRITIFDVANYFLSRVELDAGSVMTHLKLQKICYYVQAWHLVFDDDPMFNQRFQAWAHGPACPDLWDKYKEYRWHPIPPPEDNEFDSSAFSQPEIETMEAVWDAYGHYDGKYLEDLTHQEDPWLIARGNCPPGEYCDNIITLESMKEFYTKQQYGEE